MALLTPAARLNPVRAFRPGGCAGWLLLPLLLAILGAALPASLKAQYTTAPSREYQIKAVFLFNFVQFVEWPPAQFAGETSAIHIGVLGDDPFGEALDDTVRGETVRNRPLVVKRSQRIEDLKDCHLIFLCKSEARRASDILKQLEGRPVLTVSEADGFARHGGVIAFYPDDKKVRFEINSAAAQRCGLKISSQLLSLGKIVAPETTPGG